MPVAKADPGSIPSARGGPGVDPGGQARSARRERRGVHPGPISPTCRPWTRSRWPRVGLDSIPVAWSASSRGGGPSACPAHTSTRFQDTASRNAMPGTTSVRLLGAALEGRESLIRSGGLCVGASDKRQT